MTDQKWPGRINIAWPESEREQHTKAEERARELGLSLSDYLRRLAQADVKKGGAVLLSTAGTYYLNYDDGSGGTQNKGQRKVFRVRTRHK
jgi:hypothetical protein